ncbi:MAG: hypothetical protein AAF552_02965 [Pseudomonadota bacterium]
MAYNHFLRKYLEKHPKKAENPNISVILFGFTDKNATDSPRQPQKFAAFGPGSRQRVVICRSDAATAGCVHFFDLLDRQIALRRLSL